jgi:regulator of sigma E protease
MNYLAIVPILAFLIVIHELGHFFAARSVGVKVEEFGIGLPPRAKSWMWKDVRWSLNWIPFGGFVRVKGEDAKDLEPGSMNAVGPWRRGWFLIAGPLMNLLAAVVLSIVMVAAQGVPTQISPLFIGDVASGSPAASAGWQPGDRVVAVDGQKVVDANDVVAAVNRHAGSEVSVTIQRGNETIETMVTPRENPPARQGATGITFTDGRLSDVLVQSVEPGSPAALSGLQRSDIIREIDGTPIEAFAQAQGLMNSAQGRDVAMTIERDGESIETSLSVPEPRVLIRNVEPGSIANSARLYANDEIIALNGEPIESGASFYEALIAASGEEVELTYVRDTGSETIENTTAVRIPDLSRSETGDPLVEIGLGTVALPGFTNAGVDPIGAIKYDDVPASEVVQKGWGEFTMIITGTFQALQAAFSGDVGLDQFTGPIGMGQLTGELLESAPGAEWAVLLQLTILISISLGIFNLLPIPALDGGRLIFVIVEILRGGKRIAPEKEGVVHLVGMMLLLALMFFIAFGDVSRLLDGESILP